MSTYDGVTADAGWQSGVALAWILLSLASALLVGFLTRGRFALLLPILRKWCAGVKLSKPAIDTTNVRVLSSGDKILAKPLMSSEDSDKDGALIWMRGRVLFTVAGIARVWFESVEYDDCDIEADDIRYLEEDEGGDSGNADGDEEVAGFADSNLPSNAKPVFIPLEDEDDDYTSNAVAGVSTKMNPPISTVAQSSECCGPVRRGVILVYSVQLLVYLSIAAVIGFLVFVAFYLSTVYNSTTGAATFFVGMTFYCGFLLMSCCAFNKWQVTYTMHDFLGAGIMLCLTLFIFTQLYGRSSISSYLSYRATGVLWVTVSLVPLYFFVGDRIKEGKAMVSRLKDSTRRGNGLNGEVIVCPPTPRRNFFYLLSIFFQDFKRRSVAEMRGDDEDGGLGKMSLTVRGGVDSLTARLRTSQQEEDAAANDDTSSGLAWYYSRATKKGRKIVKRLCACSLANIPMDNVLWVASLAPYVLFVVLSWTSTASTADSSNASQRAPLVLLIVSVVNELTISTLVSETYSIFSQVIFSRYTLVLVGAHFWLMGAVTVLLITSAFHASQIINLYLPSPGGMVAAVYDAVADLTDKQHTNRRASVVAQADFQASLKRLRAAEGGDDEEEKDGGAGGDQDGGQRTPFSTNTGTGEGYESSNDGGESPVPPSIGAIEHRGKAGTGSSTPHTGTSSAAIQVVRTFTGHGRAEIEADLRKDLQEAEKREQFRSQFFSLCLLQVAILACLLTGMYSTAQDNLYLYPIRGKTQAAWGGLLWLLALTLLFGYLVRHCVMTGGFGSMDSLVKMVLNISPLDSEKEDMGSPRDVGADLTFTSIFASRSGQGGAFSPLGSTTGRESGGASGRSRGGSIGRRMRRDSRLLTKGDMAGLHKAMSGEEEDSFLTDEGYADKYGYSREELQFVQRNRRGISRAAATSDEYELLKALRSKRRQRVEREKEEKLRRKRAADAENTNIIANPIQLEHDTNEPLRKKLMRYFFAHFSDLVRPGLSGRTSVGFLVFAAYSCLVATATLGGWLAGSYIVIPLTAALPVAAFSFANWLRRWEAEGCDGFDVAAAMEAARALSLLWYNLTDAVSDVFQSYRRDAEQRRRAEERREIEATLGSGSADDGDVEMVPPPDAATANANANASDGAKAEGEGDDSSSDEGVDRTSRGSRIFSASFLYEEGGMLAGLSGRGSGGKPSIKAGGRSGRGRGGTSSVSGSQTSSARQAGGAPHTHGVCHPVTRAFNAFLTTLGRYTCVVIEVLWAALSSLFFSLLDFLEWLLEGNSLQFALFNLLLALLVCLVFPLRAIALSIGGWALSAALTCMAISRWRASCTVDGHVVQFMALSWLPTLAWSIGIGLSASTFGFAASPGANTDTLVAVVLVLLCATALQVSIVTYVMWQDLVVMYPVHHRRVNTNSSSMDKIVRHHGRGITDTDNEEEADLEAGMSTPKRGTYNGGDAEEGSGKEQRQGQGQRQEKVLPLVSDVGADPEASAWEAHSDANWGASVASEKAESPNRLHNVQKEWHCVAGAPYEIPSSSSDDSGDDGRSQGRGGDAAVAHRKHGGSHNHAYYASVTLCWCRGLHVKVLSPWAIGADRRNFPTSIVVLASLFVVAAVLGSALFVTCLAPYRTYGLGMLLMALYLFVWAYTRAGLLVIRTSIGYSKLGFISFLVPLAAIAIGIAVLCGLYPQYTFWYLSLGWFGLSFAALYKGVREDFLSGELKAPTSPYYFPVYAMRRAHVVEDSMNSSFIILFLTMFALWAQWASQMVEPQEMGLLMYVLCIVAGAMYLKFSEGGTFHEQLQQEVTPEITHTSIDRSIRALYRHVDTRELAEQQAAAGGDFHQRVAMHGATHGGSGLDSTATDTRPGGAAGLGSSKKRRRRSSIGLIGLRTAHKVPSPGDNVDFGGLDDSIDQSSGSPSASPRRPPGGGPAGAGAGALTRAATDAEAAEEAQTGSRYVSAEQQRRNLEFIDALVDNRDVAAAYLDETIAARCDGALSSWPLCNLAWGVAEGSLTTHDGWERLYRESLIVLHAHNDVITHASGLNQLTAMIKLRALAMAADDKRTREAELVAFLKDTQPSMREITVDDLAHVPTSLMVSLMDAYIDYRKSTRSLLNIKEAKARQEEKIIAARVLARQRKAALAREKVEEGTRRRKQAEQQAREQREREALRKAQEERRVREEEERRKAQAEAAERKRHELQEQAEELRKWQEQARLQLEAAEEAEEAAARKREQKELAQLAEKQRQEKEEAAKAAARVGGGESVVTTYGVEVGTDFRVALEQLEAKVDGGELSNTKQDATWRHQYPRRFVDPDFGLLDLSNALGPNFEAADAGASNPEDNYGKMTLRRADTILPGLSSRLEERGVMVKGKAPTPDNLHQGAIGDCWLIAGMATVCEQNDGGLIRAVFLHADHDKGIYALKIHINGRPRVVFVDDYLPTYVNDPEALTTERGVNNSQVAFCGLQRPEYFWCCLIEKAYAKVVGSYEHIQGGYEDVAMADLTGGIPRKIHNLQEAQNEKWNMLIEARKNGDLLGAGSLSGNDTDATADGVVMGHAYSILDVREVEHHRLMQMRNPWGKGEWTGRWSDKSSEWTPRYRKLLHWEDKDDGKFWISFEDFCANYRTIYVCHMVSTQAQMALQGRWSKGDNTAGGYRMQTVPVYNVKCDSACKLTVVVQHNKTRQDFLVEDEAEADGVKGAGENKLYLGIQVYLGKAAKQKNKPWTRSKMVVESEYRTERAVVEYSVEANQWLRVACATYEEGKEAEFSVNFYADCEALIVDRVPNAA